MKHTIDNKKIFIISAFVLANLALGFIGFHADFDNSKWLGKDNPHKINKHYLYEEFDKGEDLLVAIDLGREFFSQDIMDAVNSLAERIEEINGVIEVKSPLQSTTIIQKNGQLQITSFEDALEAGILPSTKAYEKRFIDSEYFGRLLSKDYKVFCFVIKIDAPLNQKNFKTRQGVIRQTKSLLREYPLFGKQFFAGEAELNYQLDLNSRRDLLILLPLSALLIILFLYFIFRSLLKAGLILLAALSSLLTTFSVSVIQGHSITVLGMSLPILILVIAIADAIHIMSRWQSLSKTIPDEAKLLKETILQTWLPCLITTVTTTIGFGCFYISELIPLKHFGADAGIAIFIAYCFIMSTMWAGLYLLGGRFLKEKKHHASKDRLTFFLQKLYDLSVKYHWQIIFITLTVSVASGYLLTKAYTETNFLDVFFKKSSPTYRAFDYVDKYLGGTGSVDIIFKSKNHGEFKKIESLNMLFNVENTMKKYELVKYVQSYLNPVRIIHKEFRKDKSRLPKNVRQLEQEILFLEFSRGAEKNDVLSPYVDFTYKNSRMHIQAPNLSSTLSNRIKIFIQEQLNMLNLSYVITGSSIYFEILSSYVIDTQLLSILITSIFIWVLFIANFGLRLGSLGMIPNIIPLLIVTGLISAFHIPFDFATVLVASVSFGLCVDNSIHFVHYYKLKVEKNIFFEESIRETVQVLGRPLVYTTFLFCMGFSILLASEMVVLVKFGAFTFIALVLALLSNVVILPAFLKAFHKNIHTI